MSWLSCPHCRVFFQPQDSRSSGDGQCPACGKAVRNSALKEEESLWFYVHNKTKVGPVAWSKVRELATRGGLGRADMVLREGSGKWVKADTLDGLFGATAQDSANVAVAVAKGPNGDTAKPDSWVKKSKTPQGLEQTANLSGAASTADTPLPSDSPRPAVLGYQILDELGRGGMGVVYKARQLRLNRVVALKMILAGAHAGTKEQERFRSEAEAVAKLQHPNIVQIYEVSESEGRPYFSLEYVDGGSLAQQLDGTPQAARKSAELVAAVARAMDAAHKQNVVHRDLKPANVLLTRDGKPKVTDFGLAKHMDSEQGQTRTGAILGTPSYMAPEQAAGRNREIGPAADVYALGAILYEMLTGRPPFRGETPMDTMLQVVGDEPIPPTRLQPKLARDLETICLKCLQKMPGKRYASAAALADDLDSFLSGSPIQARPVGPVERGLKWVRRRPAAAALMAVSSIAAFSLVLGGWVFSARLASALATASEQRQAAEKNEAEAQRQKDLAAATFQKRIEEVDKLIARLDGRLAITPNSETLRMEFLQEFRGSSERMLKENPNDPSARRQMAYVYRLIGDVWYQSFRDYTAAEEIYQKALGIQQQLVKEFPEAVIYHNELARTFAQRAQMLRDQRKFGDSQAEYRRAIRELDEVARLKPDPINLEAAAGARYELASCMHQGGKKREAEDLLHETMQMQEQIAADHPDRPTAHDDLSRTSQAMAMLVENTDKRRADAMWKNADKAMERARQLDPQDRAATARQNLVPVMASLEQRRGANMYRKHGKEFLGKVATAAAPPGAKGQASNGSDGRMAPGFGALAEEAKKKPDLRAEKGEAEKDAKEAQNKADTGREAPEITAEGLDGKVFKLSDVEGKVIVLTFWADWHAACRRQYAPQRELAEKMKNRAFAMVGVNCDEDRAEAQKVAERERMTWKNFWDGRWGRITQEWQVQAYPMTFVIDHHGVIRHRNLKGKELEDAVEKLVKEAEAK
jgi:peroxiredoxin/tRNA A-37 threonylcarbamoyl transferase component Bud32